MVLAALLALVQPQVQGQQPAPAGVSPSGQAASAAAQPVAATRAITVFVDANFGGRKNGAAKAISRKHEEMAAQGWRFAHLAPYTENGDLVGFFVTYLR